MKHASLVHCVYISYLHTQKQTMEFGTYAKFTKHSATFTEVSYSQ
jgi:hypothetical protein